MQVRPVPLVVFSPAGVAAKQEALWYAVYAVALWTVVGLVVLKASRTLVKEMSAVLPFAR